MKLQAVRSFTLKQRITPLINRYEYFAEDGGTQTLVAFVEQKRFKIREEVTAWESEARGQAVFTMKAERVLDVHGKYFVMDASGKSVGYLRKAFRRSLLRSTWEVYDNADALMLTAQETNHVVAIVRRFGQIIPILGELLVYLPFNFQFLRNGQLVGRYDRLFGLRDSYHIVLEPAAADVDRRLVLALGIALDALQDR